VEFRIDVEKNVSKKRENIISLLSQYDVSPMRRNFGVSTSRGAIMNNFADGMCRACYYWRCCLLLCVLALLCLRYCA
jgi:hypothetical protein